MLRAILCRLGLHVRYPDFIGSKTSRGRKTYAYYCCSCGNAFTRRRKLAD